jgi:hypothetical protein
VIVAVRLHPHLSNLLVIFKLNYSVPLLPSIRENLSPPCGEGGGGGIELNLNSGIEGMRVVFCLSKAMVITYYLIV